MLTVTIAEYLAWKQPDVAAKFFRIMMQYAQAAAIYPASMREWERIMQERPKPGRGGILPWEEGEGGLGEQL